MTNTFVIEFCCGKDDWFYWLPAIRFCVNGKYLSIEFLFLWWYIDFSFTKKT